MGMPVMCYRESYSDVAGLEELLFVDLMEAVSEERREVRRSLLTRGDRERTKNLLLECARLTR